MKTFLRALILFLTVFSHQSSAQPINCNELCVYSISIDPTTGEMNVVIYNGSLNNINYPIIQVVDANGDTVGNPLGQFYLFAQLSGQTVTHNIPTTLGNLPVGFTGTVIVRDNLFGGICTFPYPMVCFNGQPYPNCSQLQVTNLQLDTVANTLDVTVFNSCLNCASGLYGLVYCEMDFIQTMPAIDTLASSSCYCLWSPDNNSYKTYTLSCNATSLPPEGDYYIGFFCGSGTCDTLSISPTLFANELNVPEDEVTIFPNPSKDYFSVKCPVGIVISSIDISEISGKYVRNEYYNAREISLEGLPSGIYLIAIHTPSHVLYRKLSVIRD